MNSKSDVNRRVLAIQAKKKRHKGNKKRGKQQTNGGGNGGAPPVTNQIDSMHNSANTEAGTPGSKTKLVNVSPILATSANVCKASAKAECLKTVVGGSNKSGMGGGQMVREHYVNEDEASCLKEKILKEGNNVVGGKMTKMSHQQHYPPFKNYQHSQYAHHSEGVTEDDDDDDEEDLDLDVDIDPDDDDDDDELVAGVGANDTASPTTLSMDAVEKLQPPPYLGTPSNESDDDDDGEEESEANSENEEQELKKDYRKGGYHPVNIGDLFQGIVHNFTHHFFFMNVLYNYEKIFLK